MQPQPSYQPRPDSRGPQALYARIPEPQANGWNPAVYDQPGYNAYPAPAAAYAPGQEGGYPPTQGPQSMGQPQAPYGDPSLTPAPYGAPQQQQQQQQAAPGGYPQQPYPAQNRMSYFPQQAEHAPSPYGPSQQPQPLAQAQPQPQPQQQVEPPREAQGPPYTFDPKATYPDPNAQAWAQYYAQGGTDPTGAVYFFAVPGITDRTPVDAQSPQAQAQAQVQGQPQSQSQQDAAAGYQQPYAQVQQQSPGAGVVSSTSGLAHSPQSAHPQTAFVQAIQQQQQQPSQPPQAQLQHQPQAQSQPQPQPQPQPQLQDGPQRQASASSLPSPGAYAHELPTPYGAAAPVGPQRQGSLGTAYAPQSPGAAAGAGLGPGVGPAAEWANQYYGLQSQFAGMSVSGQGQGGEHGGQSQAQVPAQPPVGA
ncbi:hypothetical protein HETIRDRAFT_420309 [Heterobasidion irregulare TC 32-1]|uniref:Uncharacterized protein n=1 Tax=Heterobasidion irregulare (strain TC 32-1) TaxID=747525 RepID=W4K207_HETIT|nr:uncharacterized protein HETIRDRAFT_420309 [Heterobasidion irregulare TC 32-1]ETW79141.1 hypothetical protein HETIRDRAFT_420309 [Heterobasidion irregulare TC 32-1]